MELSEMKKKLKEAEDDKNVLQGELNALKKELKETFGTDDPESLKKKLDVLNKDIKKKTEWFETAKGELEDAFVNFTDNLQAGSKD